MPASQSPTVALIVLNWNGKQHLDSCLGSLLGQDYPSDQLEIMLCDNGSIDGSADYVRARFPRVRLLALDRNHGFAGGNDLAVTHTANEWVGFLNNDMWVEPTWLSDIMGCLKDHPQACCLASRIKNWDGSAIDFIGGGMNYQGHGFQIDQGQPDSPKDVERRVLFACGGAMLIRRDVFNEVGGFDADYFAFFEDVDLGWRLNLLGHEVWYTPRATAYHRHHGTATKLARHKLHVLYERNALFSIYKCFADDTLARVLPTALMLINERGLSIAGVNRAEFQLDISEASFEPATGLSRKSLWTRARRVLNEEGLASTLLKTGRLARYFVRRLANLAVSAMQGRVFPATPTKRAANVVVWPSLSASQYIAISEFAHSLEKLNAKRSWLQQRRQVSDRALIRMFEDPFFPNFQEEGYDRFYHWITQIQDLDKHFSTAQD